MSEDVRFMAYGARLAVTVDDASLAEAVKQRLPPGWTPLATDPVDRRFVLQSSRIYSDDALVAAMPTVDEALVELQSILHGAVASRARDAVFVHAGVVTCGGRAILIPGRSMSGKTSLVAALLRAGATYYSDEYAVLDEQGLVHAYPKALSIRRIDASPVQMWPTSIGTTGCPVALVIATRYHEGAIWEPAKLSSGSMALELLNNTVRVREQPAYALSVVRAAIHAGASGVRGVRGDADAIAPGLVAMVHGGIQ